MTAVNVYSVDRLQRNYESVLGGIESPDASDTMSDPISTLFTLRCHIPVVSDGHRVQRKQRAPGDLLFN